MGDSTNPEPSDNLSSLTAPDGESPRPRGRGRPRKNWTASSTPTHEETTLSSALTTSGSTGQSSQRSNLNIDEVELLLHFAQFTAYSLIDNKPSNGPMLRFWSHSLPRIGLTHHFVLHLAYALAAYHLACHATIDSPENLKYSRMAKHHASLGLSQLTSALSRIDPYNCGAVYIAATLVCYCTFAAGPTGPGDLLVCNLDATHDAGWLPLIYGVRLIREKFDDGVLFSGLMKPFGPDKSQPESEPSLSETLRARCHREGFERLDWEEPLRNLREFVASQTFENSEICLRELDGLILIYEATYGDRDAKFEGSSVNEFAFGWLYRLDKPFINCFQQRNATALVILAYYAVLLRTVEHLWFMDGWADHLLATVRNLVGDDYIVWLQWPTESLRQKM
ncbi:hypothetical protein NUW58_g3312 [Xylaria curta]|uniref:Uncharacterized protein n=1 Tax=Xylaria curta TaxID=42375 RepID=A0ACC1PC42_9PEZI|nr:hypothetical protein NUW58_g3312 [Xylaria curta]